MRETVTLGSVSGAVPLLQQMLVEQGYSIGYDGESGIFSQATLSAVILFQHGHVGPDKQPLKPDGVVGPVTWWALDNPEASPDVGVVPPSVPKHPNNPIAEAALVAALEECARGVKEQPSGSNRGPRVDLYTGLAGKPSSVQGPPWCFSGDVELLTARGWIPFKSYTSQASSGVVDDVAQVDPITLSVSLVQPIAVISKEHRGKLVAINRRGLSLVMDSSHRLFGTWKHKEHLRYPGVKSELYPVDDLATGRASCVSIPVCVGGTCEAAFSDRDLMLLGAFVADGFFHQGKIEFQVSRKRKIAFLNSLDPCRVYTAPRAYGPRSRFPLTHINFDVPACFDALVGPHKVLSPTFLFTLSRRQAALVLNTVTWFDGTLGNNSCVVTQSSKSRIDSLHVCAVLAGYPSQTLDMGPRGEFGSHMYGLRYTKIPIPTRILSKHTQVYDGLTQLYCVQVPSGLIIVRPKFGRALVVGNCALFVSWCFAQAPGGSPFGRISGAQALAFWGQKFGCTKMHPTTCSAGDIFVIARGEVHGHTGIVVAHRDGKIWTVEGNSGNAVRNLQRSLVDCLAVVNFDKWHAVKHK